MPKTVVEKFNYSELKIEKSKFFTQISAKPFCSSIFNVEDCLASCLTFRPFLTLATWLLIKKRIYKSCLSFPFDKFSKLRRRKINKN